MSHQPLKGQTALVTGASSGIGLGVAKALGAAGADVVVNYVSAPEAAEGVAEEIRAGGSRALVIRADVSREDQVQAMFVRMLETWGGIDILVNNAGRQKEAWETPQALKSLLTLIPYGRIGQPEDIGRVAVFLASDDADYINGQTIFVDGGMTLYPEFAHGG